MSLLQQMSDHQEELSTLRSRVTDLEIMVQQLGQIVGVEAASLIPPRPATLPPNQHEMQAKAYAGQIIGTRDPHF